MPRRPTTPEERAANRAKHAVEHAAELEARRLAKEAERKAAAAAQGERKKFGHTGGKPPKFTWVRAYTILGILKRGDYRKDAAAAVGVHIDTFRDWLRRGARGEEPYAQFAAMVNAVEGNFKGEVIKKILAKFDDARIGEILDFLARRFPAEFGQRARDAVNEDDADTASAHEVVIRFVDAQPQPQPPAVVGDATPGPRTDGDDAVGARGR